MTWQFVFPHVDELRQRNPHVQLRPWQRECASVRAFDLIRREILHVLAQIQSRSGWRSTIQKAGGSQIHPRQRGRSLSHHFTTPDCDHRNRQQQPTSESHEPAFFPVQSLLFSRARHGASAGVAKIIVTTSPAIAPHSAQPARMVIVSFPIMPVLRAFPWATPKRMTLSSRRIIASRHKAGRFLGRQHSRSRCRRCEWCSRVDRVL